MNPVYGTVEQVEWLSPSMVRIVLGGAGLDHFEASDATDQYVNARFVPDGAPYSVPFDDETIEAVDAAFRPRNRRYTVRYWDAEQRRLTIDFVAHGDVGYAGRWAQRAAVGDRLQISNASGNYRPDPSADWHLLVGDESALPAIAASLDALAPTASGVAIVVVDRPDDEFELTAPAGVDVRWLHRCTAAVPETLALDAVTALDWRPGTVDVFVHGEAAEVRSVRQHLIADRGIDRDGASISPYWRRGHTDEAWREIKRQWMAEQAADA
ncbi:siderophore-interacting protein [Ilumatobacter coccineus]|uniref:Putative siderophore interacting protein n=1 Tax=Ilumatobacter coccineus (strain NBRC 103263 / KCTC 29153 / YM16-304) TaxID=1313172 RepID=A0A6C7EDQ9_ILUCY|nr:siderophore-interacting protein [Ilumatobacter coccineus]BAN04453.1 putative siderophore interacting protein [Ilumatobacter coccineus YM16-304]